jgi:hypothetical protein
MDMRSGIERRRSARSLLNRNFQFYRARAAGRPAERLSDQVQVSDVPGRLIWIAAKRRGFQLCQDLRAGSDNFQHKNHLSSENNIINFGKGRQQGLRLPVPPLPQGVSKALRPSPQIIAVHHTHTSTPRCLGAQQLMDGLDTSISLNASVHAD